MLDISTMSEKALMCVLLIQVALAGYQICPSANSAGILSGYFGVPSLDHHPFLPEDGKVSYCCRNASCWYIISLGSSVVTQCCFGLAGAHSL